VNLRGADLRLLDFIGRAYPPRTRESCLPDVPDWRELAARAARLDLAPLLFDAAKKSGRLDEIPPPVALELRRDYLRWANLNEENFRELAALLDAFRVADIPVVLLKGSALAVDLYDSAAHRPMCDLDFLLRKESLPAVERILAQRGYRRHGALGNEFEEEFRSQLCFIRRDASRLTVEPHWHVLDAPGGTPVEWFWEHTAPLEIRGRRARTLEPAAMLIHLAAHYAVQHRREGLRPLADIARLLDRRSDRIDGAGLAETVRTFGQTSILQSVLREVAAVWDVPLPTGFFPEDPGSRNAAGAQPSRSRYGHHIRKFLGTPGWKSRLTYARKLVFPGLPYLRERYGMRDDRLAVCYYGYRICRLAAALPGLLAAAVFRREPS
jgi:hypothetical protein